MTHDVVIVGAGAAGLAAAILTRQSNPQRSVVLLDGARKPGAKILVSGGSRCNVTNTVVTERDFWGGPSTVVRRVLRAFTVEQTIAFFARAGVALHEEEDGKLFPDTNSARTVLDALLRQADDAGVDLRAGHRVTSIDRQDSAFVVTTAAGPIAAASVVLATGGQSLPKSGSDGAGYELARALGHTLVPTTPALVPLVLEPGQLHAALPGVSLDAALTLWVDGAAAIRLRGALLWTHFGISGPVALNVSRHWLRARLEGRVAALTASFVPDKDFAATEALLLRGAQTRPRIVVGTALGELVPASMAAELLRRLEIDATTQLGQLGRDARRTVTHALTGWPLRVTESRGYNYAEATAGGVHLREIDPSSMQSRMCRRLYLIGEILDVDGRLGGFNFQWAWSSARAAANHLCNDMQGSGG